MHFLLITRHYPPEISGGARRPLLLTEALRHLGHKVTLVTPFDIKDEDHIRVANKAIMRGLAAQDAPPSPGSKPSLTARFKAWLRQWIYWPDGNIPWARDVVKAAANANITPDWIITTSPPESVHFSGWRLSKKLGVPWAAEFRDTWTENPHRKILTRSKWRVRLERRLARKYLRRAQVIFAVSGAVMDEVKNYAAPGTPQGIITHFSKPVDAAPFPFEPSALNLVHTGGFTLSDRRRRLGPLLETLSKISALRPGLALHIAGPLTAEEQSQARQSPVKVVCHGPVSLDAAREMQAGADGLLLYTPEDSHALPGKYAEYAMTNRPIYYLGGGSWPALVNDPDRLRALEDALPHHKKGETVPASALMDHITAGKAFIKTLEECGR